METVEFSSLEPGDTFSVFPDTDAVVYLRMMTADDAVALTGSSAGRVYEFPGHLVFRRYVTLVDEETTAVLATT